MTTTMGKGGATLTMAAAMVMCIAAFILDSTHPLTVSTGICLPAPTMWNLIPLVSRIINLTLMLATAAGLYLINKGFSIVPGSATILPGIFLLMAGSIPWINGSLTSSSILCFTMLLCLALLCSSFRSSNATQEIFVIATIISVGSMIQYGFAFMILPVVIIALMFKCFRIKEIMAMILGLIAPYWVGVGLGFIKLSDFRMPELANIFGGVIPPYILMTGLINVGFTAMIALILGLYNGIKLYAGNTRRRLFNVAFNVLGITAVVCMIIDYNNLSAYLMTFYMSAAFQYANLFALWNIRKPWIWSVALCLIYLGFFSMSILN